MTNCLMNFMVGKTSTNTKSKYFWYSLGSAIFAISTLLMTMVVSRFTGEKIGGMFSLGLSVAQWLVTIAYYEIRTYQVTDTKGEFKFKDYFSVRMLMCILTYFVCTMFAFANGYSLIKIEIVLLLCLYKVFEGVSDVFEGEFQRMDRIDMSGKSMFIRVVLSMSALFISLIVTRDIIISLIVMNIICIICILILDFFILQKLERFAFGVSYDNLKKILIYCTPLAISTFLNTFIINSSKLSVDNMMGDEYQLYYTAVFMPNLVINLFSGIIFKPMQTTMAIRYNNGEKQLFRKIVFKLCTLIMLFTFVCICGAYLLGIPVLSLLYNVELSEYKIVLLILLFAGGLNALNIILYYIMTIMRKQRYMIPIYVIASIMALIIMDPMVGSKGLLGAALGYLLVVVTLGVLLIIGTLYKKEKSKENE